MSAEKPHARVDLDVRVIAKKRMSNPIIWKIMVSTPAGASIHSLVVLPGQRASFKKLEPASYVVCVTGEKGRRGCRSVDLHTAPDTARRQKVALDIEEPPPALNQADVFRVSRARLGIPSRARDAMIRADVARTRGDVRAVRENLEKAVALYPDYVEALNNLGSWHLKHGTHGDAIEYLSRATAADPGFYAAWVNLGSALLRGSRYEEALAANRKALALHPYDTTVLSQTGLNYFYLQRFDEAKDCLEKVLEMDPAYANSPQLFLAQIAVVQNRADDAEQYLRGYLQVHPNAPGAPDVRRWLARLSTPDAMKE